MARGEDREMKTPSFVGEAAAVIAVIDLVYWAYARTPSWASWIWLVFILVFLVDWMMGGVSDKGICKKCFG